MSVSAMRATATPHWRRHGWHGRGGRIVLHFLPPYRPSLNPIEPLWGLMHRHVTNTKCDPTCAMFADATFRFPRESVARTRAKFRDSAPDNFRVVSPKDFRVVA